MPLTFISYESSDKAMAFKVCEYLEANGFACWIAPRDIHAGEYAGEITRALKAADNLVVICSSTTSKSPHVRNEVSLAFGVGCKIIPFVLKDVRLDDSLEYYFAGKQRVYADKNIGEGLVNLLSVLSGQPGNVSSSNKPHSLITAIVVASLLLAAALYAYSLIRNKPATDTEVEETIIPEARSAKPEMTDEEPSLISSPKPKAKVSSNTSANADSFSGSVIGGFPDGEGKYTFIEGRRIDMHDSKERQAATGDYIIGEWDQGHLIQGKWYDRDGQVKEVILLGKAPNPEADHIFKKCVKQ